MPPPGPAVVACAAGLKAPTGATMLAAVRATRQGHPARVVVAAPVAAPQACAMLAAEADECVSVMQPAGLGAIGMWYEDFSQTSDDEVRRLLERAGHDLLAAPAR
jgi:putative phosphoribosyl transferase